MPSSSPLFSAVICTYQRYDRLSRAIESLRAQDIGDEHFDIWVMDNSPASPEKAKSKAAYVGVPNLYYVDLDTPGLSNARNEAIRQSNGTYIVFMDDDAEAVPGLLRYYRDAYAKADEKVAAIGGRITPAFEVPRPSWLHDNILWFLSIFDQESEQVHPGYQPCGANVAFRRSAIEKSIFRVGLGRQGAEASNLLSGEESKLIGDIIAGGGHFSYAPLAQVTHHILAERLTRAWFRRRASWQAVSDQLQHSLKAEDALKMWPYMIEYLKKVPREHIMFMGLLWDTEDDEIFRQQLLCTQFFTHIMISQGSYPSEIFGNR